MSQVIRVPAGVYKRLEKHAQGFDTPANVIEKLLNHYEGVDPATTSRAAARRDTTKYRFNNQVYGKGRLVLAVLSTHAGDSPKMTFDELLALFPRNIQGSSGVFSDEKAAREIYERSGHKRHFVKPGEVIQLADRVVAVSAEWGASNIDKFIAHAEAIGYHISPVGN